MRCIFALLLATVSIAIYSADLDRTTVLNKPFLEWRLINSDYKENPFDLTASVTFYHQSSDTEITTGMFYVGDSTWAFRFTGIKTGVWRFESSSKDPDLDDVKGTVTVRKRSDQSLPGFIGSDGYHWMRKGTNQAFVPQLVMYSIPRYIYGRPGKIKQDIETYLVGHGFNGFHVPGGCYWFELEKLDCSDIDNRNPDLRTFRAIDDLIVQTYKAGGTVHLWLWGDSARGQNPQHLPQEGLYRPLDLPVIRRIVPIQTELNSTEAKRTYRYIAARLGPLPGWTMGFGFDIGEWATKSDLQVWHSYMHQYFGWPHYLGARGPKNSLDQFYEGLDYSSYEQHKPDYETYVRTISARPDKPSISEDRFRIRGRQKDYNMEEVRRGLWHSVMAGGIGNIWGNLPAGHDPYERSAAFPEPEWIRTHQRFFENRFQITLKRCPQMNDIYCLQSQSGDGYILYKEKTSRLVYELPNTVEALHMVAVDTREPYRELEVKINANDQLEWRAPRRSDWALAIGSLK